MPPSPPDSEGERIYLPGWVKPSVALGLALIGAGATVSAVGLTYLQSMRTDIRDTQREVCALRQALNVTNYTFICGDQRQLSVNPADGIIPASMVDFQLPGNDVPATALVSILAGLSVGLFILGAAGFLVCWVEILRIRNRVHDHDTDLTTLYLETGVEPPKKEKKR